MRTGRPRSVRTKTIPCPTGAGLKVRVAGSPVKSPRPEMTASREMVFCGRFKFGYPLLEIPDGVDESGQVVPGFEVGEALAGGDGGRAGELDAVGGVLGDRAHGGDLHARAQGDMVGDDGWRRP